MAMVGDHTKELVTDQAPKRIKELQFGIFSSREIVQQSVVQVSDRNSYDVLSTGTTRKTTRHGPLDTRLGVPGKVGRCETCGQEIKDCNGHFGHVKLALPCFHIGYLKMIIDVLCCICKECSQVLLEEDQKRSYLKSLRRPGLDNLQRSAIYKRISVECRKCKRCPYCGATNGPVRKVPSHPMKIIHMKFDAYLKSTARSKEPPPGKDEFDKSFEAAMQSNPEIEKHIKRAVDDINPLKALNLFRGISDTDIELMGMDPAKGRPEMFIWTYVPAPPNTIRPSVAQDSATTDDDLTNKLGEIVWVSSLIRAGLEKGQPIQTIMEQWDFLQLQLAMYINSDVPGLKDPGAKHIRGFCQRLKGKQGRFRGNLSGKRVDFSGRTVIGPDPNLGIDEVAVPERVATNLTYPEKVTKNNKAKLQDRVRKGKEHPGANIVIKKNGRKIMLEVLARVGQEKLDAVANELQIGDVVERHLIDGDIVLFNRQPSLHKLSILSHRAKIRPWRTFRLNECVCNPYNADFDGDEMNLHVPQTEEARAEAMELMGVKHNLTTPKNGTPIIAAIQDFITAAYLLSSKNSFYDRKTFAQIVGSMFNAASYKDPDTGELMTYELPPPVIWKPVRLWTGKQVFNVLMRPSKKCKVLVNLDAKCKVHTPPVGRAPDMDEDDGYLVIRNSEVMCGVMDKATVGDGKKDSVFYVIMRDFGPEYAVQAMNRLAKLSARWLTDQGFSIGISDVYPSARLEEKKQEIVEKAYAECDDLIAQFKDGKLQRDPGCDEEQTMENKISGLLSKVRQDAGRTCMSELSRWNAPLIMAKSGSKGSEINVSQMVAGVGQQMIGGKRVVDGFQDRTLPHFPKGTRRPAAKGFVANSFFSGLTPYEFIFHAMSGREGLVDTAVKTAETGYMSRRLIKSLEDLSVQYDDTVRNSSSGIVQFQYGDDKLDPVDMEGDAKPVHFNRTFTQAITTTWDNRDRSLLPFQIRQLTKQLLEKRRSKLVRTSLRGETLDMKDESDYGRDEFDSERDFMHNIEEFLTRKADKLAAIRMMLGMNAADVDDEDRIDWAAADEGKPINTADGIAKISESALTEFIRLCLSKYERSVVQPGHAVGAVGAQSIGEPGTQMTLKTFHFAGVAGMSITQGVPRIKEIINASKVISTPVITCVLANPELEQAARIVKGHIEKTYLKDIIAYVEDVWYATGSYLSMRVDIDAINKLQLGITMHDVERAIKRSKGLKLEGSTIAIVNNHVRVYVSELDDDKKSRGMTSKRKKDEEYFVRVQNMKRALPDVVVKGYPEASRAIIKRSDKPNKRGIHEMELLVEGYGLKLCMTTEGVNGYKTVTNSVLEMRDVLGIEAARTTIIREIKSVMSSMNIDPRHMQLLADVMTYKGDVLGITRFGLAKMRDSVLQLASFEKTPDHLFDAAFHMKTDRIEGVSECIIMGQSMKIGTGAMQVYRRLDGMEKMCREETPFMDAMKPFLETAWLASM